MSIYSTKNQLIAATLVFSLVTSPAQAKGDASNPIKDLPSSFFAYALAVGACAYAVYWAFGDYFSASHEDEVTNDSALRRHIKALEAQIVELRKLHRESESEAERRINELEDEIEELNRKLKRVIDNTNSPLRTHNRRDDRDPGNSGMRAALGAGPGIL